VELQGRLKRDVNRVKVLWKEKGCIRVRPEMAQVIAVNQPKALGRGGKSQRIHGMVTSKKKNQGSNLKSQGVLLKA